MDSSETGERQAVLHLYGSSRFDSDPNDEATISSDVEEFLQRVHGLTIYSIPGATLQRIFRSIEDICEEIDERTRRKIMRRFGEE